MIIQLYIYIYMYIYICIYIYTYSWNIWYKIYGIYSHGHLRSLDLSRVPLLSGDKASPALPLWLMDAGVTFDFEDRNAEDLLFGEVLCCTTHPPFLMMCIHMYAHMNVCIHMCIYIYIYIYMYIHDIFIETFPLFSKT